MLKVMIIDDDAAIRDRIKSMVDWDKLGLSPCCEAADSEIAMELYLFHRPKIVITDINIPIISGLELARELSALDREIRFIVISGYGDLETVRDSVSLGAVDLLSKPLSADAVNSSLKKAVDYFENLRQERASVQVLSSLVEENLPLLQENYMAYLLSRRMKDEEFDANKRLEMLRLDIAGENYAVAVISCDAENTRSLDPEMLLIATCSTAEALIREAGFKCFTFYDNRYLLNCVLSWNGSREGELLEETIVNIYDKMIFFYEYKICAGLGCPVSNLGELYISAMQAREAYNYQGVFGSDGVINYKNVQRLDGSIETDRKWVLSNLEKQFRLNDMDALTATIKNHFSLFSLNTEDPLPHARTFAFEYAALIISTSFSLGVSADAMPEFSGILADTFSCYNIPALLRYVLWLTEKLCAAVFKHRTGNKNQLIRLAKEYIEENIGDKYLDLDAVSYHVGFSSIYFCRFFHKEEGISFSQYLNERRISRAKEIMANTTKNVSEISYELGYSNPKYFSYVFKRMTGLTPMEYRKSL